MHLCGNVFVAAVFNYMAFGLKSISTGRHQGWLLLFSGSHSSLAAIFGSAFAPAKRSRQHFKLAGLRSPPSHLYATLLRVMHTFYMSKLNHF